MFHNTRLERLVSNKHSNLLGLFISYDENEVLWILSQNNKTQQAPFVVCRKIWKLFMLSVVTLNIVAPLINVLIPQTFLNIARISEILFLVLTKSWLIMKTLVNLVLISKILVNPAYFYKRNNSLFLLRTSCFTDPSETCFHLDKPNFASLWSMVFRHTHFWIAIITFLILNNFSQFSKILHSLLYLFFIFQTLLSCFNIVKTYLILT